MNIFKVSFRTCRSNSDEIFGGFGYKHHSNATELYLHPNNQAIDGSTTLAQPIGEAITLLATLYNSFSAGDSGADDLFLSESGDVAFLSIKVPDSWHLAEVVEEKIDTYRAYIEEDTIKVAAYDKDGKFIESSDSDHRDLYKLLPCLTLILADDIEKNIDFQNLFFTFLEKNAADLFVNIHEDFYQSHKTENYELIYTDIPNTPPKNTSSLKARLLMIAENKNPTIKTMALTPFKKDDFLPEYQALVPTLPEEFVIPSVLLGICNAIVHGDSIAVLLHGPAGTGKTMGCKLICKEISIPIMDVINCTENLDEFVLGKFIPDEDRIIFKESYVTKAIRHGGAVVFEEINFAKPQYLAFLNSLLDDNGFVRLDNGEIVKRHKNFRFFATMNLGYFGTKELNQALYNRFSIILELAALSDEAITKMLIARVPECADKVDKILRVYHKLKKKIDGEELDIVISPRNLENWARLAKYEGYIAAAEKTIIPIAKCERSLEDAIRGIIVLYKWN